MKKISSVILICAMCALLAACGNTQQAETTAAETTAAETAEQTATETETASVDSQTVVFVDDAGREVEIPATIERIIPTGSLSQIILYAIAPEKFVGLSNKWDESAEGLIPDEYYNLQYYGAFYGNADMNIEELAKANPQLLIDIGEEKDANVEELDNFTLQTGIPIVFIYADLENMDKTYERLGELFTDKKEYAAQLSDFCSKTYSRTAEIMEKVGDNKVKALYILGEEGLNVLANGAYHAEAIDMLVDNLAVLDDPSSKGVGNEVGLEQIALWNPDFIIFGPDSIYDSVKEMPVWTEMTAIANDNYVETPSNPHCWMGTPPSVQRYLGLIWLPSVIYPEYCDYDVEEEVKNYYELFYHVTLTDEQYAEITKNAWLN